MKVTGTFKYWFVWPDLGTMFPKNMFYSWHVIEEWEAAEL